MAVDRPVRIGVQLQPQHATYASIRQACADAEEIAEAQHLGRRPDDEDLADSGEHQLTLIHI